MSQRGWDIAEKTLKWLVDRWLGRSNRRRQLVPGVQQDATEQPDHSPLKVSKAKQGRQPSANPQPQKEASRSADNRAQKEVPTDRVAEEPQTSGEPATPIKGRAATAVNNTDQVLTTERNSRSGISDRWIQSSGVDGKKRNRSGTPARPLRLGIDYGTSTSKLVITDYGSVEGETSFVVRSQLQQGTEQDCRIPSTVSYDDGTIHFGFAAESRSSQSAAVYRSLKMLCAYPNRYYGDPAELPPGLSALDLATLYVGHLVQLGQQAGNRYAGQYRARPSLSVTLGVPMAQLDDARLQSMFVDMARQAFALRDKLDLLQGISTEEALKALSTVREELSEITPSEPRDWVRSEAEAALFWAHSSPDITDGRYACVDIGAGTTSASWFHINPMRVGNVLTKDRLSFYAADCAPPGCDAIDTVLAKQLRLPTIAAARGRESELLEDLSAIVGDGFSEVLDEIGRVYGRASAGAFEKEKRLTAWKGIGRIFFLGGGSKIEAVRDMLIARRREWLNVDPIAEPGTPANLTEEDGSELKEDPTFLLVAYGLARRLADVPDISPPSEVLPYQRTLGVKDRSSHEDLYST